MDMDARYAEIAQTIQAVADAQLNPAFVRKVLLSDDYDHDGDHILVVKLVIDVPEQGIDPDRVRGLIRHLREPLKDYRELGFPVISLIRPEEYSPEAA